MNPTRKRRLWLVLALVVAAGIATALVALALQRNVAYLYTPSEVRWTKGGAPIRLIQMTRYPLESSTEFRIETATPQDLTVYLRIPAWAAGSTKIRVNGEAWNGERAQGHFAGVRRKWKNGDTMEFELPLPVHGEAIDDRNKDIVALMRGPLMMVVANPPGNAFPEIALTGELDRRFKPFYEVKSETYSTYFRRQ